MLNIGDVHYDGPYFAKLNDEQCKTRKCTKNMNFCWFSCFEKTTALINIPGLNKNIDVIIVPDNTILVSEKKRLVVDKQLKLAHVDDVNILNDIDSISDYDGYYFITGDVCSTSEYYDNVNIWLKIV